MKILIKLENVAFYKVLRQRKCFFWREIMSNSIDILQLQIVGCFMSAFFKTFMSIWKLSFENPSYFNTCLIDNRLIDRFSLLKKGLALFYNIQDFNLSILNMDMCSRDVMNSELLILRAY